MAMGRNTMTTTDRGAELDMLPDIVFVIDDEGTILECRGGDPSDLTASAPAPDRQAHHELSVRQHRTPVRSRHGGGPER